MATTFDDMINKYRDRVIEAQDKVLLIAASSVVTIMAERIFEKGLSVEGKEFEYSTKPIYINTLASPKNLKLIGKTKKATKTTQYFSGGYKEFRKAVGRSDSPVNFRLTNDLQSDFLNAAISKTSNGVGSPNLKVEDHQVKIELKREINIKKKTGLEKKYSEKIFSTNDFEKTEFSRIARFELNRFIFTGNAD